MERNDENERNENERPLREQSPEEAKRTMKEKVSRGIATVAGALEGFTQQMRENDVPQKTKEAVEKVGETTRKVSEATRREGRQVKQALGSERERHEIPVTGTAHRAGQATTELHGGPPAGSGPEEDRFGKKPTDLSRDTGLTRR